MKRRVPLVLTPIVLSLLGGWVTPDVAVAETAWVHAAVETQGSVGEQVTRFRAFTTSDEAGNTQIVVSRLCVKGVAHQEQEKCAENASSVELVERTVGLPGVGSRCVEAFASATWKDVPLSATARACP